MQIHTEIDTIRSIERPIVTIGTFDGVHLGHRAIIKRLNEIAVEEDGESVLLTFHPHPRTVVNESGTIELLTSLEERFKQLENAGLQHVIVHPFTKEFSRITALSYVRDLLVNRIGVHYAVVGYDHHFGKNREGDIDLLHELAEVYDFRVEEISAQAIEEVKVSSTKVRNALKKGLVDQVSAYLGYHYQVKGTVIHGDGRGKEIGFPTANLIPEDSEKLIPALGVYAVYVHHEDKVHLGMCNIGTRPTFYEDASQSSIEVNLFGWDKELYGEQLTIEFRKHIREEKKFETVDLLTAQLEEDKKRALGLL